MASFLPPQKELKEIDHDKASGVTADIVGDNLQHLIGSVPGPKDTPYEGGLFRVDIQLDAQYPFAPPKMRFMTRVWHPNVSSANGAICLGEGMVCLHNNSVWRAATSGVVSCTSSGSVTGGVEAVAVCIQREFIQPVHQARGKGIVCAGPWELQQQGKWHTVSAVCQEYHHAVGV
jgi:hypothetical protein